MITPNLTPGTTLSQKVTASIVLYNHNVKDVGPLFEALARDAALSEWVVVDNGGSDEACVVAELLGARCLHPGRNLGYGAAHNLALREVIESSELHFVLNPDIHFGPLELDKMVRFMRDDTSIGQLMPKVVYEDGSLQYLCKLIPTPCDLFLRRFATGPLRFLLRKRMERFDLRFTGYNRVMDVPYLSGCFMLFRTAALRKIGLFDEQFFMYPEDIDITRRMNAKFRTVFFPGATIMHDHARESYKSWRSMWIHVKNMIRYFNKWGWFHDPERSRINRETLRRLEYSRESGSLHCS